MTRLGFRGLGSAGRRRVLALAGVMLLVAGGVGVIATFSLYQTGIEQTRHSLGAVARSQARLIEALAVQVSVSAGPEVSRQAILERVAAIMAASPLRFEKSAAGVEVTVATRAAGRIDPLLTQPGGSGAFAGGLNGDAAAEPMQRALAGRAGTLIDRDHRGREVLAAYEPIPAWPVGVVARLDLAEVRQPLFTSILNTLLGAVLLIGFGLAVFLRTINPLFQRTETNEIRLQGILANAVEGIVTFRAGGEIIEFNAAAEQMFGCTADSAVRQPFANFLHSGSRTTFNQWLDSFEAGYPPPLLSRQELIGLGSGGRRFVLELSLSASRSEGQPVWTAIIHDITRRREAENALLEAKAELSHRVEERTVELQQGNRLLRAVSDTQSGFLNRQPIGNAFHQMLHNLLVLTASPVGFVAELGSGNRLCYRAAWDELGELGVDRQLDFNRAAPLWEPVLVTRRPRVAEGPELDPLGTIDSLLAVPLRRGGELMGIAVVANGELTYAEELIDHIEPFLGACGNLIHELRLRQQTEQARRRAVAAEQELQGILDNVQDVIFRTDLKGRVTWISGSVTEFSGRRPEELVGRPVDRHITERGGLERLFAALNAGEGRVQDFETRLVDAGGQELWISTNCQFVRDGEGRPIGIEGVCRDITGYKQAQLRAVVLNRLYSLLGHANRVMVRSRDKQVFYRELCRAIADIGGFRMVWIGEIDHPSRRVLPVVSADTGEGHLEVLREIPLDDGEGGLGPIATAIRGNRIVVINDIATDPRMAPWREAALANGYRSVAAFPFGMRGEPFGSLNVYAETPDNLSDENVDLLRTLAEDISHALSVFDTEAKRREAVEHLSAVNQKLSHHIEHTPLAVIEFDSELHIRSWNRGAESVFGFSAGEAIGRAAELLVAPEESEEVSMIFRDLLAGRVEPRQVTRNRTRDGKMITCEWYNTVLRAADGRITGVMSLAHDISDEVLYRQKLAALNITLEKRVSERTRELEAVNRELEAFSYSVSHDLRAPLRSIDGFSQLLLRRYGETLDATGQDYLRRVRTATQRMALLIDDLLRLSRVTRRDLIRERVDLTGMAEEIVADLCASEPERQVAVKVAPGMAVFGDAHLLRIALENLLRNAWKFTSKKPQAQIEVGRTPHDGRVAFFVRDNGAGFDMAYVHKLFGAFQRLHTPDQFEGTGIGLATVQRIVHRLGGQAWAEGEPEQGAIFYFTLQVAEGR